MLSHIKLWKFLYDKKTDFAIIFEDDIIFNNITKQQILDQIMKSDGFDIVFLGYCYPNKYVKCCEPHIGSALCTHAYAVSRKGLEKLVKLDINYFFPIDKQLKKFCKDTDNLCFLSYDVEDIYNYGNGLIKQDLNIESLIENNRGIKFI